MRANAVGLAGILGALAAVTMSDLACAQEKVVAGEIDLFARPGESENATFAMRPLQDLGNVSFDVGPFVNTARRRTWPHAGSRRSWIVSPGLAKSAMTARFGPARTRIKFDVIWRRWPCDFKT